VSLISKVAPILFECAASASSLTTAAEGEGREGVSAALVSAHRDEPNRGRQKKIWLLPLLLSVGLGCDARCSEAARQRRSSMMCDAAEARRGSVDNRSSGADECGCCREVRRPCITLGCAEEERSECGHDRARRWSPEAKFRRIRRCLKRSI